MRGYRDAEIDRGVYTYKVTGVAGGKESFPASAFLSTLSPRGAFLRGDADASGRVDINDPIRTLNFLFLAGPPLPCEDAADANDDGVLSLSDPITTLNHLFLGRGVLRAPGTKYPWFDPTPDALDCRP